MNELASFVKSYELDLLVIDNWALVSTGDSNNADEVTPQLAALSALCRMRPDLTIVLIHHARKMTAERGVRITDRIRNSGAFGAWYDTGIVLERSSETSPVTVRAEHRDLPAPVPFQFDVEDEKAGDPAKGILPTGWMRLFVVGVGQGGGKDSSTKRLEKAVLDYLRKNPGCSESRLAKSLTGRKSSIIRALEGLCAEGRARVEKAARPGVASKCFAVGGDDEGDDDAPSF